MLKRLTEIPRVSNQTKAQMNKDILWGITLDEFNTKYPAYRMNVTQFNHYQMALRRGDRV